MGWAVGYDTNWERDVGYGVPSICDHPDCNRKIDRGLSFVCGGGPFGGGVGCGLYFCWEHMRYVVDEETDDFLFDGQQVCERCAKNEEPFEPTPDTEEWINHKETDPSWQKWRDQRDELNMAPRDRDEFEEAVKRFHTG